MFKNLSRFSYFPAPISNVVPAAIVSLQQLYRLITSDERMKSVTELVRSSIGDAKAFREAKAKRLPFVTPAGIFQKRNEQGLLLPSSLFVVDVDHLESAEAAARLRDIVFEDKRLNVQLAFVSPSGTGVKFFIPFTIDYTRPFKESYQDAVHNSWTILKMKYGVEVDKANDDIARCCFLAHDSKAKQRF